MPFTFKLSKRLALMKASLAVAVAAAPAACERILGPAQMSTSVVQVISSPDTVTLDPYQTKQFLAYGRTQAGESVAVVVRWSATGGTIASSGLYTADTVAGTYQVTATAQPTAAPATSTAPAATSSGTSSGSSQVKNRGPLAQVVVSPASASFSVGGTQQFAAYGRTKSGDSVAVTVAWSATGGTISTAGLYTAGQSPGTYRVIATQSSRNLADTTVVTISSAVVASVAVSPASATVSVGQTVQLVATLKDAAGNVLSRPVSWASSNTAVATVSGSGLVTAVAAGSATISATSGGVTGTAAITVPVPVSTTPGAVTDLAVASVTDSSATLSFTEVNDGTGLPASYDIRWAVGAIAWGVAPSVTRGTCATPVAGTAIGNKRTCTVLGLVASTGYQFQLVAFRGTLNVNAVFGNLSNVASGTTAANSTPVASVAVSPATASVAVGQTVQLVATPKDALGNVLSSPVNWSSSNAAMASVGGSGLVTGVGAGAATITATSGGVSATVGITVTAPPPPPPGGTWPNEPAGYTMVTDWGFDVAPPAVVNGLISGSPSPGWYINWNSSADVTLVADATAPFSPPAVYQVLYPTGFAGGSAPGSFYTGFPSAYAALYVGFWWKPSNPWQGHSSGVNKILFINVNSGNDQFIIKMLGTGAGPFSTQVTTEMTTDNKNYNENAGSTSPLALGVWHRIEMFMSYSGGVLKWWVDGVLVGSYTGIPWTGSGFSYLNFSPTWGGVGDTKTETDYYWYDHVHASHP